MVKFVENNAEPNGVNFGMRLHIGFDVFNRHPFPGLDFFGIDLRFFVVIPDHDMIEFMFGQAVVEWRFVNEMEQFGEFGRETHFFEQSAFSGFGVGFAFALVAAAGIGPQQRRMVFVVRALLQHDLVVVFENKYRKRPVQNGFLVRLEFWHEPDLLVVFVDENDVFFFHNWLKACQKYEKNPNNNRV
jgi:hypothetical protein